MARTYTKGKRAEQEAETRLRIIEAALDLHAEVGPAATTISMIAERAGVQRHTVYAHLPDERSIFMACSGLHIERDPPPDPAQWAATNDPELRLRQALTALYAWFAHNEQLLAHVFADAERSALMREISALRFAGPIAAIHASLAAGLDDGQQAALAVAMSFYTWRTLSRDLGLPPASAVAVMVRSVRATG
jgi:AcrR family transcriptional regulator